MKTKAIISPCKYCGKIPTLKQLPYSKMYYYHCNCHNTSGNKPTIKQAKELWNHQNKK